jgi:hypothetical protein
MSVELIGKLHVGKYKYSETDFYIHDCSLFYSLIGVEFDGITNLCLVFEAADKFTLLEPSIKIKKEINHFLDRVTSKTIYIMCHSKSKLSFSFNLVGDEVMHLFKIYNGYTLNFFQYSELFVIDNNYRKFIRATDCYNLKKSFDISDRLARWSEDAGIVGVIVAPRTPKRQFKTTFLLNGIVITPSATHCGSYGCMTYYNLIMNHKIEKYDDLFKLSMIYPSIHELTLYPHDNAYLAVNGDGDFATDWDGYGVTDCWNDDINNNWIDTSYGVDVIFVQYPRSFDELDVLYEDDET